MYCDNINCYQYSTCNLKYKKFCKECYNDYIENINIIQGYCISNKIQNFLKYKNQALELFKINDIKNSIKLFEKSLNYLCNKKDIKYKINILNNLSICYGIINKWDMSINFSKKAYELDELNSKSVYRLVLCYYKLNKFDLSINISKKFLDTYNSHNDYNIINKLYKNSVKSQKEDIIKSNKFIKKMF